MRILKRICWTAFFLASLGVGGATAQTSSGAVSGTVSLPSPDGQPVLVPGVTLTLTCAGLEPRVDVSSETGQFRFADVAPGDCSIVAELQGFKSAVKTVAVKPAAAENLALQLDIEALHEEVNVVASQDLVDSSPIARVDRITASEILGPVIRPLPMALLGLAGEEALLRGPNGQAGLVKEGDSLGELKLLRIGTNRVLVEQAGEKKELMIFSGYGGETLVPKEKDKTNETTSTHP
jgi:hypothetical protein